jgi:RNA polymerase sigma-70 factor (ECF subfamily)
MPTTLASSATPDRELAARFARDAEPFFSALARRARRLTRSDADADDLLQDALLHALAGYGTFQEGTNLRAWLFRILHNRWISNHHSRQCRVVEVNAEAVTEHEILKSATRLPGGVRSAESEVLNRIPDGDVRAALTSLPVGFAEALVCVDVEGYSYAETAEMLETPIGTVMSRVHRARRRMRLALAHRNPRATHTLHPSIAS